MQAQEVSGHFDGESEGCRGRRQKDSGSEQETSLRHWSSADHVIVTIVPRKQMSAGMQEVMSSRPHGELVNFVKRGKAMGEVHEMWIWGTLQAAYHHAYCLHRATIEA